MSKKFVVIVALLLILVPLFAVSGQPQEVETNITANDYGDDFLVLPGTTIKYNLNELVFPEIPNITISDLAGNKLYVKVMAVETKTFEPTVIGNYVYFGIGLIFETDETISIGTGITALDIVIPAGAATPPITGAGVPHLNTSTSDIAIFFLDNGWIEHESMLEGLGFTVVNGESEFSASYDVSEHVMEATWRKSDGILTDLYLNDFELMELNYTGITLDISLDTVEYKPLSITLDQEIQLNADIAKLTVEGTGEYYSMLNETAISEIETLIASMQDQSIISYKIVEISGLYYKANVLEYSFDTQSLVSVNDVIFCGFLGGSIPYEISIYEPGDLFLDLYAPIITPDYDIYAGYMVLLDTIAGVYLDDIISFIPQLTTLGIDFSKIEGNFELIEQKGYYFIKENFDIDMSGIITISIEGTHPDISIPDLNIHAMITQEAWIAYTDSGILAGLRIKLNADIEITTEYSTMSGIPSGTVSINFDLKLRNPNYNPPDPFGKGIIPGFTWVVAFPILIGLAALSMIKRKK